MVNVELNAGSMVQLGSNLFIPSLAQIVNVGFGPAGVLGIVVAVAGAALYFLRSVRPELARDHDIFFAAVGLLCGGVLFFQGWRLDPILLFGQLLLAGSSIFFAVESIRLRQVATVQAKRSGGTPIFEEEPPYSGDVYAELDEFGPGYDEPGRRQIRGTQSAARSSAYIDELPGENRPRRSTSGRASQRPASSQRSRKPRPPARPESRPRRSEPYSDPFDSDVPEQTDERATPPVSSRRSTSPTTRSEDIRTGSKPRKSRPRSDAAPDRTSSADYVDYQPIDYPDYTKPIEPEQDNSANFDDFDDDGRG